MPVIGDVIARMGTDDSGFKRGIESAGKWSKSKFASIGAAASASFAAAFTLDKFKEIVAAGKDMKIFADQAGITAEQFQRLNTAIEKSNGDTSDTVSIMLDLKRAMADARTGKKEWVDRFALFGVTLADIKKDNPVALFTKIGEAVAKTSELTGEQVDALGKMMGEDTSARAIAAFRNNFISTMKNAIVLTDKEADALKEISDAFGLLGAQTFAGFGKFISENKEDLLKIATELGKTFAVGLDFLEELISLKNAVKEGSPNLSSGGASAGTGAGMSIAEATRLAQVREFAKANPRKLQVSTMFHEAQMDAAPAIRRYSEIQAMFVKAQAENLAVLKQIRDKTGSGASTDAAVMGTL